MTLRLPQISSLFSPRAAPLAGLLLSCASPTLPCATAVCDSPPADICADASTLLHYEPQGTCDAKSGDCAYSSTEQPCPFGCASGICEDPTPGDLALEIPVDASLCTLWGWGGDDVNFNWQGKARVTLNEGTIVFPSGQDLIPADPIALLEVWPGITAVSSGPGSFSRVVEDLGATSIHHFTFQQDFVAGLRSLSVEFTVDYAFEGGLAQTPVRTLDPETLFNTTGYEGYFHEDWKQILLLSCHYELLEQRTRAIVLDNGDRITFTVQGWEGGGMIPPSVFNFELVQTVLERGNQSRTVTDFFAQASNMNHHGCCPSYLAQLDQDLDAVHRFWIDEFSYGLNVQYYDSNDQFIESVPYTDAP